MASLIRGLLYFWFWYGSVYSGFLLVCCPVAPFILLHPKIYQFLIGIIFSTWEMYPTVLMRLINRTKIILTGDYIRPHERALLLMNHRTRCDWNFFWAGMYYASQPPSHRLKMILKAPIRKVPGPGWVMQMAGYLYIHRDWAKDQALMAKQLNYYKDVGNVFQLLIFPEGTDLTQTTIEKSNKFADKNNLPHFTKVLHPKTTGFSFLVDKMRRKFGLTRLINQEMLQDSKEYSKLRPSEAFLDRERKGIKQLYSGESYFILRNIQNEQLDAVYDITLAYPYSFPQNELELFRGNFPEEVHFNIRRYSESEIPQEESLQVEWLKKIWQKKETDLINFHAVKKFTCNDLAESPFERPWTGVQTLHNALYLAFVFWTSVQILALYLFLYSSFFRWYALFCTLSFILISAYTEGFQMFEVNYYGLICRMFGSKKTKAS